MQRPAIGLDAVCLDLHLNNTHIQDTNTVELYPRRRTQSKARPGWLHGDTGHGPAGTAEDLLGNSRPHSSRLVRRCQQPQAASCVYQSGSGQLLREAPGPGVGDTGRPLLRLLPPSHREPGTRASPSGLSGGNDTLPGGPQTR